MKKVSLVLIAILFFGFALPKEKKLLTKENLWQAIVQMNIKYPDLVFAQAILETGHFKSINCITNNNLFGMKLPRLRETVATKSSKGYAKYSSWEQSVYDYKLYQDYLFSKREYSRNQYTSMLDRVYCQSSKYTTKLESIINRHKYIISKPVTNDTVQKTDTSKRFIVG